MRKVTLTLFALLSLMVLMIPLAYAPEPPTSLEVWLEIDLIVAEPLNGGISLWIESRVIIMNVGENVAHIGWVSVALEIKRKHEPWTWLFSAGSWKPDHFIDPGKTDEVSISFGHGSIVGTKAFRLRAEVELGNHPTGLRVFHYRMSFNLPEM